MLDAAAETLRAVYRGRLLVDPVDTAPFLTDYRRRWTGRALAVAEPSSTAEVSQLVRWCAEHEVAAVPQGGNTGLSGGAVPSDSGRSLVISLRRLDRIRALDPVNNTITVEAGVTLARAQQAAEGADRLFPLSLAAEGSCTIGGNLATNAGGVQVLRYGNARELCLGLEVVTASGECWGGLRGLRKDNTGYDLRDLIVGSEGTLGIITAAVLKLFPRPAAEIVGFAAVSSPADALTLLSSAQRRLGAGLTAFELLSDECLSLVLRHAPGARHPLEGRSPWYVLLELSDTESEPHARTAIEELLGAAFEAGTVTDATVSASLQQFDALWGLREAISDAQAAEGASIKHDISLPISRIPDFIATTGAALGTAFPALRTVVFGHLGDGNLHYNLSPPAGAGANDFRMADFEADANRLVHDAVVRHDGSISAEHGLGVLRRDEASRYKSPLELDLMHRVKAALDPRGLLNPGKLLKAREPGTP
jgi:FAD/FMN-containing dehydrogenase